MRENMAASLNAQLDFIFFFYGLAFILFGAVCFAISPGRQESTAWATLELSDLCMARPNGWISLA